MKSDSLELTNEVEEKSSTIMVDNIMELVLIFSTFTLLQMRGFLDAINATYPKLIQIYRHCSTH
jgi:hypothetical protein